MVRKKSKDSKYKIISLRKLSEVSKVEYMKLYYNISGRYKSLDGNDKTAICNALYDEMQPIFDYLGFDVIFTRKDSQIK